MTDIAGILKRLGIDSINAGAWSGTLGWSKDIAGSLITSSNPATGETLAQVRGATVTDYEAVMRSAVEAATAWRAVPAPRRGEAVRLLGDALRAAKEDLGALVTLENGKIKAEGLGEVQEMIDIADFAVGQSRMLYGLTMHSERPQHRMYEQWHPLGVVGIISAFNFPVAVWAWNSFLAAICGNASVWKPSPKTPLTAIAVQHICNQVMREHKLPAIFQLFIDGGTELATRFVDDRRVALVSFTGSTAVGRNGGGARGAPARQGAAGARRQQRHHRRRVGGPETRGARHRVRRGRHRGPALHDHAPRAGASLAARRAGEETRACLLAGAHRQSDRSGARSWAR